MKYLIKAEYDYVSVKNGQLVFEPGEIEKYVDIEVIITF